MSPEFALITFAVALCLGLAVAIYDLKTMTIPNWLSVGSGVVFLGLMFAALPFEDAIYRVIGGVIVLVVCMLLFFAGQVGGGDAKTAPAFALTVAPVDASFVLLMLAVFGLLGIGLIALLRRTALANGDWMIWSHPGRFPYGVTLGMTLIVYTALVAFLLN
ncbi:MAG: prepilin peptidase [Pseudomonadota bacterium]